MASREGPVIAEAASNATYNKTRVWRYQRFSGAAILAVCLAQVLAQTPNAGSRSLIVTPDEPALPADSAAREQLAREIIHRLAIPLTVEARHYWHATLWRLSGRDMRTALRYSAEIPSVDAQYRLAYYLGTQHRSEYAEAQRPRQLLVACGIALLMTPLLLIKRMRRAAAMVIAGPLLWAVWTGASGDWRELPPGNLRYLTVGFLGLHVAAFVCAALALLPAARTRARTGIRIVVAAGASAVAAAVICSATRSTRMIPVLDEAWALLFDPLGAFVLAGLAAVPLSVAASVLRRAPPDSPRPEARPIR